MYSIIHAGVISYDAGKDGVLFRMDNGASLSVNVIDGNAVRVKYYYETPTLPEYVYINDSSADYSIDDQKDEVRVVLPNMVVSVNKQTGLLSYFDKDMNSILLEESSRSLKHSSVSGKPTFSASQTFVSSPGESLFGLGQFQDGILNVRGLSRRLTQVNTQISVPLIISDRGYGILWNNYGMTEFNPASEYVDLVRGNEKGEKEVVNVTSSEGGVMETRESNLFRGNMVVAEDGYYSLLLDVGQPMARRHDLTIGDKKVFSARNLWLPPTTSNIVWLKKGEYPLTAHLEKEDSPRLYFRKVDDSTTFMSPVAEAVDYTVMCGSPDKIVDSYRRATGKVPLMPDWALGYIHCRERFHNQDELLSVSKRFSDDSTPVDLIVQDWQYWGKYGWNSMTFDESLFPSPKSMVDSLHASGRRLMLSVWSKIDPESEVGKEIGEKNYFIPGTSWVDFFNPNAAECYWKNFSGRLLVPFGIDAWWQDATEPENDDLVGRVVASGTIPGEVYRNAYPLFVNKTVYEGVRKDNPGVRTMILTRSAFPGMQRFATATWSGDVGWDWDTFRRQITAGLGMSIAGQPWWTYDAGGFFRPGNQYESEDYHELMMRWIQTSVFLPLMRVHGYVTDTEYWNYGDEVSRLVRKAIDTRYRLAPYLYSENARISYDNSTLLRPLVMDFSSDSLALKQKYEYMFGPSFLVAPVVEPGVKSMNVYLPSVVGGWYDFKSSRHAGFSGWHNTDVKSDCIPVFVKAGSIVPLAEGKITTFGEALRAPWSLNIYAGADGKFTVYEDDGVSYEYENGKSSRYNIEWNDSSNELTFSDREGEFGGMPDSKIFNVCLISGEDGRKYQKRVEYNGKAMAVSMK